MDELELWRLADEVRRMRKDLGNFRASVLGTHEKQRQQLERAIEMISMMRNVAPSVVRAELEAEWSNR